VNHAPEALHVAETEPEELIKVIELQFPQALLSHGTKIRGRDGLVLKPASFLAEGHLGTDFGPGQVLHLGHELDDLHQGHLADGP
jgi:hypothetical protein